MTFPYEYDPLDDVRDELLAQDRAARAHQKRLLANPRCDDPDHPGCDLCRDEDNDECDH